MRAIPASRRAALASLGALAGAALAACGSTRVPDAPSPAPPTRVPASTPTPAAVLGGSTTARIIATRPLRPISRLIYGVAAAQPDDLAYLRPGLHRWGGNPSSRYNWELGNAWSSARDWEFRNGSFNNKEPHHRQPSGVADQFVEQARAAGAEPFLTVPALGWVARDDRNESRSVNVPDSGAPALPGPLNALIPGYDAAPNRAATSVRSFARKGAPFADSPTLTDDKVFQDEWIAHLKKRFGGAAAGGVRYYAVDNEPDLWDVTHTDVRPDQLGYTDFLNVFTEYAGAIKDVDAGARVLGPAISGWTGLLYSPKDRGVDNYKLHAERRAHGDEPFLQWWLAQVRQHDERAGRRTLDLLDVHWYPQAQNVYSESSDPWTSALRLRSTRSLWDASYKDESWIGERVRLIPRLRDLIDLAYPGTQLAIGEWNWGAEKHISGGLAVADVLGIFGREGVDLAAYWTVPPRESYAAAAFTMYTSCDGRGLSFGDQALEVQLVTSPDELAVYAARDTQRREITVVAINKRPGRAENISFLLEGASPTRPARVFQLAEGAPLLRELAEVPPVGHLVSFSLPPASASLLRIPV